jgi:hypothetical protein
MAVEVDQPGHDHGLGVDRPHSLGSTLADRGDISALDDDVPIVDAILGSEDNAAERERLTGLGAGSAREPLPLAQDRVLWDGPADAGGVDGLEAIRRRRAIAATRQSSSSPCLQAPPRHLAPYTAAVWRWQVPAKSYRRLYKDGHLPDP